LKKALLPEGFFHSKQPASKTEKMDETYGDMCHFEISAPEVHLHPDLRQATPYHLMN
jgi:hypothetical protein